ncbi:hypothetical protein HY489_00310 [Candidatus Woesearchaeota archaeon]|nr:hypothetical protein [Candidatus Woesearchaeota archaeon]
MGEVPFYRSVGGDKYVFSYRRSGLSKLWRADVVDSPATFEFRQHEIGKRASLEVYVFGSVEVMDQRTGKLRDSAPKSSRLAIMETDELSPSQLELRISGFLRRLLKAKIDPAQFWTASRAEVNADYSAGFEGLLYELCKRLRVPAQYQWSAAGRAQVEPLPMKGGPGKGESSPAGPSKIVAYDKPGAPGKVYVPAVPQKLVTPPEKVIVADVVPPAGIVASPPSMAVPVAPVVSPGTVEFFVAVHPSVDKKDGGTRQGSKVSDELQRYAADEPPKPTGSPGDLDWS